MKRVVPALFTSTSSRPNSRTAAAIMARHTASSATLPAKHTAWPPSVRTSAAVRSASSREVL